MLSEEEAYKIAQLAILFPEVQAELNRISETLESVAANNSSTPSPSVKNSLMAQLGELKKEEQKVIPFGSPSGQVKEENLRAEPYVIAKSNKTYPSWLLAASIIGFVISLGILLYFFSQNRQNQTQLVSLKQEADTLRNTVNSQQQQILAFNQTIQIEQSNDYKKINLINVPGKPQAIAHVHWNINSKEVYACDISLPQAPSNKQYQLWAIVDGKPVDAGMLDDVKYLVQKMKVFEKAEMFAITLEKKGGSPSPTMDQMYVAGKV